MDDETIMSFDVFKKAKWANGYLHLAVIRGYTEIIEKAIELGADMNQLGEEKTLIGYAEGFSRWDIVEALTKGQS